MLDRSALFVGLTSAAFLFAGIAPATTAARPEKPSAFVAGKGDRLTKAGSAPAGHARGGTDEGGAVMFRSDPMTSTTWVAKTGDNRAPGQREPAIAPPSPSDRADNPSSQKPPKTKLIGCENAVSPLVRPQAARVPGLCVT